MFETLNSVSLTSLVLMELCGPQRVDKAAVRHSGVFTVSVNLTQSSPAQCWHVCKPAGFTGSSLASGFALKQDVETPLSSEVQWRPHHRNTGLIVLTASSHLSTSSSSDSPSARIVRGRCGSVQDSSSITIRPQRLRIRSQPAGSEKGAS